VQTHIQSEAVTKKFFLKMKRKFFIVAAAIFSSTAAAQTADSIVQSLNEVVVTPTKFSKKVSETGKVVSVITKAQLERSAGKDLAQLLNEQAGIVISGAGSNPGKDKAVYLRGALGKYTVVLLDGIPVTDPSGVGGAFDLRLLPIDMIERVEILKGSQSTLYGSDAIAGVINIITKRSGNKQIGGYGTASYGSVNTFKGNAGVAGNTKTIDYNIGYTHFTTDGISEANDKTGAGNFDKDGFKQNSFNATLNIKASDKLKISPFARFSDFKGNTDADAFTDGTQLYNTKALNAGLSSQYQLPHGAVTFLYGYTKSDHSYISEFFTSEGRGRLHNAELFFNNDLGKYIQLLAGVNLQRLKMLDTTAILKDPSVTITSPYVSFFLKNLGGFNLQAGGRYNSHSKYGSNFTYTLNPSYLVDKNTKLFFNFETGFKAPTLYDLYGQYGSNADLKPEKSRNIEAGVQASFADNKIELRVAAFDRKIEDAIVYGPSFSVINRDQQHDKGFEVEPTFFINKDITIRAAYSFVTGQITTSNGVKDTVFNNLVRRPKHNLNVNIGWQATKDLFVSTNIRNWGKRTDWFYDPITFERSDVELKAFAVWDIYAEYKLLKGQLKIFADVKNITGSQYFEVYGYSTMGFNMNAGVQFKL
jgi:vitamin B12 transporter